MVLVWKSRLFRHRLPLLGGLAVFLVGSLPLWFGLRYFNFDLSLITIPQLCELRQLKQSGFPFWVSSLTGGGEPFYANFVSQFLYPVRWIEALFEPEVGASVGVILHLVLAFLGTYWLGRTFRLQPICALAGGFFYVFSGTYLDLILHSIYISGGTGLPWVWAASRALRQSTGAGMARGALFLSLILLIFAGEPQSWLVAHGIVIVEAGVALWGMRGQAERRHLALSVFGTVFCAGLVSFVFWGPALSELGVGSHLEAQPVAFQEIWNYSPVSWLATIWRGVLTEPIRDIGNLWTFSRASSVHPGLELLPWNRSPYLGLTWLSLALAGIRLRRFRWVSVVLISSFAFSLGSLFPALTLVSRFLPFLQRFHYPEKYLVPMTLAASLLGAGGLASLKEIRLRNQILRSLGFFVGASLVAVVGFNLKAASIDHWAAAVGKGWSSASLPLLSEFLVSASLGAATFAALGWMILKWFRNPKVPLIALVVLDLSLAATSGVSVGPQMFSKKTVSPIQTLLRGTGKDVTVCHSPSIAKLKFSVGESGAPEDWYQFFLMRLAEIPNIGVCDGLRMGVAYSAISSVTASTLSAGLDKNASYGEMGLGCSHVLSSHPIENPKLKAIPLAKSATGMSLGSIFSLYEVLDPLPSAFWAKRPVLFSDQTILASVLTYTTDFMGAVRLIDDPSGRVGASQSLPTGEGIRSVQAQWENPSRIRVRTDGVGAAVVGVRTAYARGWRATQATEELPTLRMAGKQLGFWIKDPSRGPVVLEYWPPRLNLALAVCLVGLIGILSLFVMLDRTERRTVTHRYDRGDS